jgi:HEPN domain-containing protein
MRPDTIPWWRQADADLASGEIMLTNSRWYAASWFAQQAAEKALKALWIEQTHQEAVRTHDVRLLGRSVNAPNHVEQDLTTLFPIFSLTRYPDALGSAPIDTITEVEARQHIDSARRVLQWVLPQL